MPVLSEHPKPSMGAGNYQATTKSPSTSSTCLFISLAILLTLGITISRRKCKKASTSSHSNPKSSVFICKRRISSATARMMQATPPTSALPEKPYLPDADAMEGQQATSHHEDEISLPQEFEGSLFYSPQLQQSQNYQSRENLKHQNVVVQTKATLPPPFHTRLGSLPAVTTSLLHPEPPSPTIVVESSKFQPSLNQNPYSPPQNQFHYTPTQSPSQYHPQNSQFQPYTQNEILFVPSPTEYTSFEALYSKFPPSSSSNSHTPIYHGENPTSYTEATYPSSTNSPATNSSTLPYPSTSTNAGDVMVPRRRSYIKTLSNGSEMSGEVVEAAGQWRRHTRVFGGGVCIACEESESRRMSA